MMKRLRIVTISLLVITTIVASSVWVVFTRADLPSQSRDPKFIYSAKFLCGPTPFNPFTVNDVSLGPGFYQTDINIHNPSLGNVTIEKKAVEALPEDFPLRSPTIFGSIILIPDGAFRIDCGEIFQAVSPPFCIHGCIRKGFVSIISNSKNLDVIAVYTVSELIPTPPGLSCCQTPGNTTSIDVETVLPKTFT